MIAMCHCLPFDSQQSTDDKNPYELGQFFDPQTRLFIHSSSESQSPSLTLQGSSVVQKSSSPRFASSQQSVELSNPNECKQLFDPHVRPARHWSS